METVNKSITLNVSKLDAWTVIAHFGNAHKYFKSIIHSRSINKLNAGVGAIRHCDLPSMMGMKQYIDEEITDWKEGEEFTYKVTSTAAPIKNGIARWLVCGDNNQSKITVDITYQPSGILGNLMKSKLSKEFNKQISEGLKDIKTWIEVSPQHEYIARNDS